HLDTMRTWERIFRRAGVGLAYSHGFAPHPRLVFAAPLAVGITSTAEILDVYVEELAGLASLRERVAAALPPGIGILDVEELAPRGPAVMAQVEFAEYEVELATELTLEQAQRLVAGALSASSIPYQRTRSGATRLGDVRPVLEALAIEEWDEERKKLRLCLRLDREGEAVRPDEVLAALSPAWQAQRIHRVGLILKEGAAADAQLHVAA
ncbi:MAG: TIGR03936 family radical SAM-associated protein, partial [Chloroflexota bacterium]